MLKIRDDVELKKLEAFGFEKITVENCFGKQVVYVKSFKDPYDNCIRIRAEDREISYSYKPNLDTIYDLINADMVEKVEDERWRQI